MLLWQKGDFEIAIEKLDTASHSCHALLKKHWQEIANYKDEVALNPRWDELRNLEKLNKLIILTLRKDQELIGYSMFVTNNHLHYDIPVAFNDILYVAPEYRNSKFGLELIAQSEIYLKTLGCRKIQWHIKPHMDWSPVLKRRGYIHEELIYGRLL